MYTQNDCYNDVSSSYKKYNMSYDEIMDIYTDISSRKYRFSKPMPYNSTDRIAMLSFALNAGTKSTDIKTGNTNIIDGISPEVINGLNQISGIASIDYSVYESERSWFWDNQDYTKMGIDKLKDVYTPQSSETVKNPVDFSYADRYLFATEYVNPTQKIYDIASKYIDESLINYDDFKNGKQVIVFLQDNCFREYDNTLSAGDTLYYNYYAVPFGELGTEYLNNVYRGKSVYSYDVPFYNRYNNNNKNSTNSRIDTLLMKIELENRRILSNCSTEEGTNILLSTIDYSKVNSKVSELRSGSIEYLKHVLEECDK